MNVDSAGSKVAEKHGNWIDYIEQVGLALIAIASVLIAALHFTGFLDTTFLGDRLGSMTLLVGGLIAGYLVVERRGSLERLHESDLELSTSLRDVGNKLRSLERIASRASVIFEGFGGDQFAELRLLYGLRGYNSNISTNEIRVGVAQTFDLWADALRDATSFLAFNYVSPDEVWGTRGWAFNMAHALQLARMHVGCSIKRVFVIDNTDEYYRLSNLMTAQQAAGMEIKWILKSEISNSTMILEYLKEIGTWDFIAIDTDLLLRVELDENRHMRGSSLTRNREIHRKAAHVFNEGIQMGRNPKDVPSQ
jgi:hypothetical protein